MSKLLFLLFGVFYIHSSLPAQNYISPLEISVGLSFSRPLGINKNISYQSGNGLDLSLKYHFLKGKTGYGFASLKSSYQLLHIEGYFKEGGNSDSFFITPSNVKTNFYILTPISLEIGYCKNLKTSIIGVGLRSNFLGGAERNYKIDFAKYHEKYTFQKKLNYSIFGLFGLKIPNTETSRVDFIVNVFLTSLAKNMNFRPFSLSLNFTKGFSL